jgi:hypothetical protein
VETELRFEDLARMLVLAFEMKNDGRLGDADTMIRTAAEASGYVGFNATILLDSSTYDQISIDQIR